MTTCSTITGSNSSSCHHASGLTNSCCNSNGPSVSCVSDNVSSNTCASQSNETTLTQRETVACSSVLPKVTTRTVASSSYGLSTINTRYNLKRSSKYINGKIIGKCHSGTGAFLFGLATSAVGFLLGVGAVRIASTTDSTKLLERPLPILVEASLMALTGFTAMLASRKKFKWMIILSIILSFASSLFCFASFIYLLTDVNVSLQRLEDCTFQRSDNVCQCYVQTSNGRRTYSFSAVQSCATVQNNLRELVYGVCVLFGIGFAISCATMVLSCYLLYTHHKKSVLGRTRSLGDGCNELTSITTQTNDTSCDVTSPLTTMQNSVTISACSAGRNQSNNNASVATQTPMYMMPVAQLVYEMNASVNNYRPVNLLLGDRDEPPPPYSDTFI